MDHERETHDKCDVQSCWVYELFICKHCGLYEGSLTTHCPGVPSYLEKADDVYKGKIDFRNGEWVEATSPHSPEWWRQWREGVKGFEDLAEEWLEIERVLNDPYGQSTGELEKARVRQLEIEGLAEAMPYEYDGEGTVVAKDSTR